ncbi:DNA-binding domain-containing protein [Mixta calida]|nr:hypothetical protein [Pantoea sp.]QNU44888.1 hypothetical protein IDH70_07790 [Mixta calida]
MRRAVHKLAKRPALTACYYRLKAIARHSGIVINIPGIGR